MSSGLRTTLPSVDLAALNRSFAQDADRARDSYTNHTATALRRRALAATNGHAPVNASDRGVEPSGEGDSTPQTEEL